MNSQATKRYKKVFTRKLRAKSWSSLTDLRISSSRAIVHCVMRDLTQRIAIVTIVTVELNPWTSQWYIATIWLPLVRLSRNIQRSHAPESWNPWWPGPKDLESLCLSTTTEIQTGKLTRYFKYSKDRKTQLSNLTRPKGLEFPPPANLHVFFWCPDLVGWPIVESSQRESGGATRLRTRDHPNNPNKNGERIRKNWLFNWDSIAKWLRYQLYFVDLTKGKVDHSCSIHHWRHLKIHQRFFCWENCPSSGSWDGSCQING